MGLGEQIKAAEGEVERLRLELSTARKRLDALYVQRSTEQYGIQPGMRVQDRHGLTFIVDSIRPDTWGKSKPWLYGRMIKKDGSPGTAQRNIYDQWEIVAP